MARQAARPKKHYKLVATPPAADGSLAKIVQAIQDGHTTPEAISFQKSLGMRVVKTGLRRLLADRVVDQV